MPSLVGVVCVFRGDLRGDLRNCFFIECPANYVALASTRRDCHPGVFFWFFSYVLRLDGSTQETNFGDRASVSIAADNDKDNLVVIVSNKGVGLCVNKRFNDRGTHEYTEGRRPRTGPGQKYLKALV